MSYTLSKYEKETVLLYNQSTDPILIDTYDPSLQRRLADYAARYPDLCRKTDKGKYDDYREYEIGKDRISIRLLPPMSEEQRKVASEKAKAAGLGGRMKIEPAIKAEGTSIGVSNHAVSIKLQHFLFCSTFVMPDVVI